MTHEVPGPPTTPDIRVNDDQHHEEQCTQVVNAQADDEDIDET